MKFRSIFSWILIVPVALLFALAALGKLGGSAAEQFVDWGYAPWFAFPVGVVEGLGAIGLLIPRSMRWSVYGLSIVMVGAAATHILNAEYLGLLRPAIFAGAMWAALYFRYTVAPAGNSIESRDTA